METNKDICPTQSRVQIKKGALIVDVRTPEEVAEVTFDVPNYINIPFNELEDRFAELPKDKTIIIACIDGKKSERAAQFLINLGYNNVHFMRNGLKKWAAKEFPIIGNAGALLDENSHNCKSSHCC